MAFVPVLSLALTAGSAIISGIGQQQQYSAASSSYSYQAQVARNNAIIAEQNAEYELQKGERQGEAQNYKTRALLGAQKAGQAASGIDVNSGSALKLRQSTAELGHLDALTLLNNAAARAAGYRAQAMNFTADAGLDEMKASSAKSAGKTALVSSLIGGASSLTDKWLTFQQKGIMS